MKKICLALLMTLFSSMSLASNGWYYGKVTQIQTLTADGSFIVYIDNAEIISNCQYGRVRFMVADMGLERTKAALSMALAAFSMGKEFGVVVDIDESTDSVCFASKTAGQGAGIK